MAELSGYNRDHVSTKLKIFTFCPLRKKFANLDLDYYLCLHQVLLSGFRPLGIVAG